MTKMTKTQVVFYLKMQCKWGKWSFAARVKKH